MGLVVGYSDSFGPHYFLEKDPIHTADPGFIFFVLHTGRKCAICVTIDVGSQKG